MEQVARVLHGPPIWVGKTGRVIRQTDDLILVALQDNSELVTYHVWMPLKAVEVTYEPPRVQV